MARKDKQPEIVLEPGQLWQTDKQGFIHIVQLGKTLAHYRRSLTIQQSGLPIHLVSMTAMVTMLKGSDAQLVKTKPKADKPQTPASRAK
jgi:hypothetical protein